ncbi:MAG TPA: non-homologous end-joining DNA ligase [Streptosporangiaceae bacterium]|nr:non-homologous end-joining DNA ligase [Streptosporangiaceae bacterium]
MIDRDRRSPPAQFRPMLASVGELPADDAAWAYEMKWDGLRAIATVSAGALTLTSRTGRDMTSGYPELAGLAEAVGQHEVVLDGEIVALRGDGWPSFEALQQRMNVTSAGQVRRLAAEIPVSYLAFDLLFADGRALADLPYRQRRARLDELGVEGPHWQTPPAFIGVPGADVRAVSRRHGLEGIMAKRLASRYEAGKRSPAWRKIKNVYRQEFVVGGWKPGEGNRSELIGSLIVGVQCPAGLTYAGHVGTGFSQQALEMLTRRLAPLRRATCPFGSTVPAEHARGAVWVEPQVVIEAEFALWTNSGRLRAASYRGLRDDKDPADVVRESPADVVRESPADGDGASPGEEVTPPPS